MDKVVKIAVLGTGKRAHGVIANLLGVAAGRIEVAAVYDPNPRMIDVALELWKSPDAARCGSEGEAIHFHGVEWVMIFSPNACHKEQILQAFAAGKHVFAEKPLATCVEDCMAIYHAQQAHPELCFSIGFVLRYAPIYRKIKELLDSGVYGKLVSINADENIPPHHGGYIMCNWRRYRQYAGTHMLEKCCHDLDLLNWFCRSLPTRVASFGGLNIFTRENAGLVRKYGIGKYKQWKEYVAEPDPFLAEKDIMDNQVAIAEYRNGVRVVFQATMSNAIPERRMYFTLTEGTIIAEIYSRQVRCRGLGDSVSTTWDFSSGGPVNGHAGGDEVMQHELFESIYHGAPPKCSGLEGLESAILAIAFDEAATANKVVELEPVWREIGK